MPEPKHTPKEAQPMQSTAGPWDLAAGSFRISGGAGRRRVQAIYQHNKIQEILAFVPSDIEDDGTTNQEQKANAHLIAASPELLGALAELVKATENLGMGRVRNDAKALLARLRNEGA